MTCQHGYFTHQHIKCPWCHGINETNKDVVPVQGKGNGWLLLKDQKTCPDCGGPAGAGNGLIPSNVTQEWWAEHRPLLCRNCAEERHRQGVFIPRIPTPPKEVQEAAKKQQAESLKRIEEYNKPSLRNYPEVF